MGRRDWDSRHPILCGNFFSGGILDPSPDYDVYAAMKTDGTIMVRVSRARWAEIQGLARQERRSGTMMMDILLDRAMGGRAGYELAVMADERASRLMSKAQDGS
jgi:hypothetical protein